MDMYLLPSTAEFDDACHPITDRCLFAERIFDLESHIRICPLSWYLLREDFLDHLCTHIRFSMLDNARNTSARLSISVPRYGAKTHIMRLHLDALRLWGNFFAPGVLHSMDAIARIIFL